MKKLVIILIVFSALKLSAQNYDLIVKANGDSIACRIDSITDTKVYFEMKIYKRWIHTEVNINEITKYKYDVVEERLVIFETGSSYIKEIRKETKYDDRSIYSNRYLFAPSAFPMKDSMFSYSNITLGLHDFQYGFSDRFSAAFGTTIFFFPFHIFWTYTLSYNENSAFAIGDLIMFSPFEDLSIYGNLLYGMYTKGTAEKNFSISLGLWTTSESDLAAKTISPALNFSAILKTGYNNYFITENYAFQYNVTGDASIFENNIQIYNEEFSQPLYVIGGISGFRFIGINPQNSWQLAMAYIFIIPGDAPNKYKQPNWEIDNKKNNTSFVPWPIISYTRKF